MKMQEMNAYPISEALKKTGEMVEDPNEDTLMINIQMDVKFGIKKVKLLRKRRRLVMKGETKSNDMTGEVKADTKGEALKESLGGDVQRYDGRGDC